MQKVQSYLYPNRIILLADVAGFTVENKVVYARTIKIYQGVDNVVEFDIQNADQKRIDLTTLSNIEVNVMDISGNALDSSPYSPVLTSVATATNATVVATTLKATTTTVTVPTANITGTFVAGFQLTGTNIVGPVTVSGVTSDIDTATTTLIVTFQSQTVAAATGRTLSNIVKGLATLTIPENDLIELDSQSLRYSVTAVDRFGNTIMLYNDSQFGATGTMQLISNAMPTLRDDVIYDEFVGEINFMGNVINHSPAIPCKFYEAEATEIMDFEVYLKDFIGTVYVEATEQMTVSLSAFQKAPQLQSFTCTLPTTTTITFSVPVSSTAGQYNFMRVSWLYPDVWQYGSQDPTSRYGSVTKVVVSS